MKSSRLNFTKREINKALNKLTISHQDLARNTNKVDVMLDQVI
jgi:hypothetical protein